MPTCLDGEVCQATSSGEGVEGFITQLGAEIITIGRANEFLKLSTQKVHGEAEKAISLSSSHSHLGSIASSDGNKCNSQAHKPNDLKAPQIERLIISVASDVLGDLLLTMVRGLSLDQKMPSQP